MSVNTPDSKFTAHNSCVVSRSPFTGLQYEHSN